MAVMICAVCRRTFSRTVVPILTADLLHGDTLEAYRFDREKQRPAVIWVAVNLLEFCVRDENPLDVFEFNSIVPGRQILKLTVFQLHLVEPQAAEAAPI